MINQIFFLIAQGTLIHGNPIFGTKSAKLAHRTFIYRIDISQRIRWWQLWWARWDLCTRDRNLVCFGPV